jgi:hypothetical protein
MMKKLLTLIALIALIALTAGVAGADTYIGLFGQPHAVDCFSDTGAFTTTTVHVVVWVDVDFSGQISAVEFFIDNLPETSASGIVTENWNTPLKIGYLGYGIALAFADPLQGPLAYVGSIDFYTVDPAWIPADYVMAVRPSRSSSTLAIVDQDGIAFPVEGGQFTFNCSDPGACDCLETVAVDDASWSSVKALY